MGDGQKIATDDTPDSRGGARLTARPPDPSNRARKLADGSWAPLLGAVTLVILWVLFLVFVTLR